MGFGFSMRVLLLFTVFGHYAFANFYRYSGRNVQPNVEQVHASPRSYKPASSYEGFNKQSGLSESSGPSQGPSGAYGRRVDGYSHQGSVSNYKPASAFSKPRETLKQPPNVQYSQASHEGHNFGSGVVSSGAIEIIDTVEPSQQQPGPSSAFQYGTLNLPSPHSGDGVKSGNGLYRVPGMYYSSKPSHEGPGSNPHIKWDAPLGSTQSSPNLNKQMTGPRPVASGYSTIRQQYGQQANPVQQPPSSSGHIPQTKAGMWNLPSPHSGDGARSGNGLYRVPGMYSSSKPSHEGPGSNPHIKWDAPLGSTQSSPPNLNKQMTGPRPVASGYSTIRQQSGQQANPVQWQPSLPAKPQQATSDVHILQTNAGMWDLPGPFSAKKQLSATRVNTPPKPYQKQPGSLTPIVQQVKGGVRHDAPRSSRRLDVETQNSKPVPVASLYSYEGQRPQLRSMHNRNRQPLAL